MEITVSDILAAFATAAPDQLQAIKETVAPETKKTRLQGEAQALLDSLSTAYVRAQGVAASWQNAINNDQLDTSKPDWLSLVQAFAGSDTPIVAAPPVTSAPAPDTSATTTDASAPPASS